MRTIQSHGPYRDHYHHALSASQGAGSAAGPARLAHDPREPASAIAQNHAPAQQQQAAGSSAVRLADNRAYGESYRQAHPLPRAAEGHAGHRVPAAPPRSAGTSSNVTLAAISNPHNSCRNRHCPKCGALARRRLEDRKADLLPVGYFHLVFTLPPNSIRSAGQQGGICDILFKAVSQTLLEFGRTHLGGTGVHLCAAHLGPDPARSLPSAPHSRRRTVPSITPAG